MAIPQGGFAVGVAGTTAPGGAYTYQATILPGTPYNQYFGGSFLIDTGYDDPVSWTMGVQAAEVYAARVYASTAGSSPAGAHDWLIAATPVWSAQINAAGSSTGIQQRVFIRCECYMKNPPDRSDGSWYTLTSVVWSLYRI